MKHDEDVLWRAASFAGIPLNEGRIGLLRRYADWLATEAATAGAIGPEETSRILDRHIADSLVFGGALGQPPSTLIDVGSGAGLPGIPLAIAYPETAVTLLDRSQRRTDLLHRAIRILDLDNATVDRADVTTYTGRYDAAVFRASLAPQAAVALAPRLIAAQGVAAIALSREGEPPQLPRTPPQGAVLELIETPEGVLDSPAWILRMTLR